MRLDVEIVPLHQQPRKEPRPPKPLTFEAKVEIARARNDLWGEYCKTYYDTYNSYEGNATERYRLFVTEHGDKINNRIGSILGNISGMPQKLVNKTSLYACGLINIGPFQSGIDRTSYDDKSYAGSVFYSIKHEMYKDNVVNINHIKYIAQNRLCGTAAQDEPTSAHQSLENPNNAALVRSKEHSKPVRVFSTDHGGENNIRYLGLYKITGQEERRVDKDGKVVAAPNGFRQYVFTLRSICSGVFH
jgi:hypothetical protein